jgi:hypothetical protein
VDLLRSLGVKGIQKEFEALVEEVKGHALSLNLLGSYLNDAHAGDIRKRDLVTLEDADAEEQGRHAFRVMDAYVRWIAPPGFWAWLRAVFSKKEREVTVHWSRAARGSGRRSPPADGRTNRTPAQVAGGVSVSYRRLAAPGGTLDSSGACVR